MSNKTTLLEYFPNYLSTDSLFTKMSTLGAPWTSEVGQDMDDAYFTMYSGVKNPTKFVTQHLNPDGDTANSLTIARILWGYYGQNWTRLWEAFKTEYTPIDNYNVKETVTRTADNDRTIAKTSDSTSSGTDSSTTEYGQTISTTGSSKTYNYGFNSSTGAPTGEVDETGSEDYGGSDTTNSTTSSTGKVEDNTTDNLNETENIERVKTGNVGQNTYQELLKQEFELWQWNFFTRVFEDVDKFLVLSVYTSCAVHSSQLN